MKFPWIICLYIPAGCTGLFQPCDVGLQRVLKVAIRNSAHSDIVDETVTALRNNTPADRIINDQTVGTLRDCSIQWLVEGFRAINDSQLVKKAFSLCRVPNTEFNLSHESLTSREALRALAAFSKSNPDVYREFTSGKQQPPAESEDDLETGEDAGADAGYTVVEVSEAVLRAQTAEEATQPLFDDGG
ncbi:hypothetical protein FRC07_008638, partial [Ceratobasidium sp. 392]